MIPDHRSSSSRPTGVRRRACTLTGVEGMKVAVVGGGSTYTPELADGVRACCAIGPTGRRARSHRSGPRTASTSWARSAPGCSPGTVTRAGSRWTTDLDRGSGRRRRGAPPVAGRRPAGPDLRRDLSPRGAAASARTTGAGGLAKAMRTVPVVLDIAAEVARRAATGARIVDFTNPVGIVTRALLDAGHRAVGLCNVAIGFQRRFAGFLDVAPDRIVLDHIGTQSPDLGTGRVRGRGRRSRPPCCPTTPTRWRPRYALPASCWLRRERPVVLSAVLLRP